MNRRTRPPRVVRTERLETALIIITGLLAIAVLALAVAAYPYTR